ncbi:hypothetical protein SCA6_009430 [Theobroma cacao]
MQQNFEAAKKYMNLGEPCNLLDISVSLKLVGQFLTMGTSIRIDVGSFLATNLEIYLHGSSQQGTKKMLLKGSLPICLITLFRDD